eukprot:352115-Chlamydomonas_euryale.AAC.6
MPDALRYFRIKKSTAHTFEIIGLLPHVTVLLDGGVAARGSRPDPVLAVLCCKQWRIMRLHKGCRHKAGAILSVPLLP